MQKENKPFYKKRPVIIIGIILLLAILGGIFKPNGKNETYTAKNSKASSKVSKDSLNSKILQVVRKEPKVIEAIITDVDVLYVSVKDDGTRRDGYAQYLCSMVQDFCTHIHRVKVIKVGTTNDPKKDNAYGVELGDANCKSNIVK
jgi:hypothetical protein